MLKSPCHVWFKFSENPVNGPVTDGSMVKEVQYRKFGLVTELLASGKLMLPVLHWPIISAKGQVNINNKNKKMRSVRLVQ